MKMMRVLLAGCLLLVTLFGCGNVKQNAATEDAGVSQVEREAYYNTFEAFRHTFTKASVKEKNHTIWQSDEHAGEFYEIYDDDGHLLDYGYHGYRGSFDISLDGTILTLEYGFGGTTVYPQYRFYDVSKGSVSRYFDGPVAVYGTRVAGFCLRDDKALLIVQNAFDTDKAYREFTGKFDKSIFLKVQSLTFSPDGKQVTVSHCETDNESHVIEETFSIG